MARYMNFRMLIVGAILLSAVAQTSAYTPRDPAREHAADHMSTDASHTGIRDKGDTRHDETPSESAGSRMSGRTDSESPQQQRVYDEMDEHKKWESTGTTKQEEYNTAFKPDASNQENVYKAKEREFVPRTFENYEYIANPEAYRY